MSLKVIVVGGGLSGCSAAHAALQRGASVVLIDKQPFLGGNSVKATSGINGALTKAQIRLGIADSPDAFLKDTAISAAKGDPNAQPTALHRALTYNSASAVEWLVDRFDLDLSLVSRLGGHSFPRTHRGKERFPGMTITYALMEKLEEISRTNPERAQVFTKCRVDKLVTGTNGDIIGVEYVNEQGERITEHGVVIIATGGYGADFAPDSLLLQHRPDLAKLPTTNGEHCSGDGIKMSCAIGAGTMDMKAVQVHPTGLVKPDEPDAKVKFLAAEALRGCGGILLDNQGQRFCDELGRRDYVTGEMWSRGKAPYRLILNSKASKEIEWHCKHYCGRGLMKQFASGADLAREMGVAPRVLEDTFHKYNDSAAKKNCPFSKKFFPNVPFEMSDSFHVAIVTPVIHYCMGGLHSSADAEVCRDGGDAIPGLYAAGEVMGGVHGQNRLGGSSLLDCVVFGRIAGDNAAKYLLQQVSTTRAQGRLARIAGHLSSENSLSATINGVQVQISWPESGSSGSKVAAAAVSTQSSSSTSSSSSSSQPQAAAAATTVKKEYSMSEVAKHNTDKDCWVVVNGRVLDVSAFLKDHPGGKEAIMLFAGKDATAEFNMLHKPDVVDKFAPQSIIGTLKQ